MGVVGQVDGVKGVIVLQTSTVHAQLGGNKHTHTHTHTSSALHTPPCTTLRAWPTLMAIHQRLMYGWWQLWQARHAELDAGDDNAVGKAGLAYG